MLYNLPLQLLVAASCTFAAPLELTSRAPTVAYNSIPVAEGVPDGTLGALYEKYKPSLKIENACRPYPAVDADGNVSEGLILLDNTMNDCQDASKGQVYARAYYEKTELKGQLAIMYAWYIPKETYKPEAGKPEPGQPVDLTQHKHAWHWVVVYLSSNQADATLKHVKYQNAGNPTVLVTPSLSGDDSNDKDRARTHPNVVYKKATGNSHEVCESKEPGEQQKLLAWERFTDAAKTAISTSDFGGIKAPLGDYNTFKSIVVKS